MIEYVILAFWLSPLALAAMMALGFLAERRRRRSLGLRRPGLLIVQVPTVGNHDVANRALLTARRICNELGIPCETWAVIEEGDDPSRYAADRRVVVPRDFKCEALYKARALEYARRLRVREQPDGNYAVLQLDDDSVPTPELVRDCYYLDADVMVATIAPRAASVAGILADYERPVACAVWCAPLTNISAPVWGHGEGMCIAGRVDRAVSYDVGDIGGRPPLISSEDMVYLHKAVHLGFRRVYAARTRVVISTPLTLRDAYRQRRRWLWGNIRAALWILPPASRARVLAAWAFGMLCYAVATAGAVLVPLGLAPLPPWACPLAWASLAAWLAVRGAANWLALGRRHGVLAALASYVTATLNFALHLAALLRGDPRKFEVIRKA